MGEAGTKAGFQKVFAGAGTAGYGLRVASLPLLTLALVGNASKKQCGVGEKEADSAQVERQLST